MESEESLKKAVISAAKNVKKAFLLSSLSTYKKDSTKDRS